MPPSRARRPAPPKRSFGRTLFRFFFRLLLLSTTAVALAVLVVGGAYLYFVRGLPSVEALREYHPPQVTKVYCADGSTCGEFFRERRTLVDIDTLPAHVKNAFLAAEDADFYQHQGLDYVGLVRAVWLTLTSGHGHGASTITQQVCKNLLLTSERTFSRKVKEVILALRLEKALSKDEILGLYMNGINFGHGRYGVEEAALFYFGKHAKQLTLGEAAMLGGIPQGPAYLNPVSNMVRAKKRQTYVLQQMSKHGFSPEPQVQSEIKKAITLAPRPPAPVGQYYMEEIRRMLSARYGDEALLSGGMRVEIAMDPKLQGLADDSVRAGLEAFDKRTGYRGALGTFPPERYESVKRALKTRLAEAGRRAHDADLVADLSALAQVKDARAEAHEADEEGPQAEESAGEPIKDPPAANPINATDLTLARTVPLVPLKVGTRLGGFVTAVNDTTQKATVDFVGHTGQIAGASVAWARPKGGKGKLSEIVKPGQLVLVRITATPSSVGSGDGPVEVTLDQIPQVQGALVVIAPETRHVVALTGGYDFAVSAFNRVTQAKRQPGSTFKPFIYAAALGTSRFTSLSQVNDAPEAIRDPYTGKTWKPQNYEKGGFEGPMSLREALTKSKNTVSVRLIEAVTPEVAIDLARRAGIRSPLPSNLTLALGTGEVSPLELVNAYATLESLGRYAEPILLTRVTDSSGKVLEEHQAAFEETLPPPVAYLATSLMRSVVEEGTAMQVRELGHPAAGKTGTASEFRDAWFSGYTMHYVATSWVGYDSHDSLGRGETGAKAALPIWLTFMKGAHEGLPVLDFPVPPGIQEVRVDPTTGLLAGAAVPGRTEPFLDGTAPTAEAPPPGELHPDQYMMEDTRRGQL